MIYHKDWLIRQIEQMVDAVTHLLADTQSAATWTQSFESEQREQIEKALRAGEICKAEDWLYEHLDPSDPSWLRLAVEFYGELNQYSDDDLLEHNFSREEIEEGIRYVCLQYDFPIL